MSPSQTAKCVGLGVQNASDFLRSKAIKRLLGESYTPQIFEIESTVSRESTRQFTSAVVTIRHYNF